MIEPILVIGIILAIIAWYAQHRWRRRVRNMAAWRETAGLEILAQRYARDEISRDEFLRKRDDILEGVYPPPRV
ncbi:MAG TPA: SHOCT domain-containing protein [Xanthobacteraceae bacterium]|jgi:uncharacterized membrane protein|nr:SHOCT domain-containing protein [Xanthobacteraceae bacterium]